MLKVLDNQLRIMLIPISTKHAEVHTGSKYIEIIILTASALCEKKSNSLCTKTGCTVTSCSDQSQSTKIFMEILVCSYIIGVYFEAISVFIITIKLIVLQFSYAAVQVQISATLAVFSNPTNLLVQYEFLLGYTKEIKWYSYWLPAAGNANNMYPLKSCSVPLPL